MAISAIRHEKLKQSLMQGKSIKQSMLDAGYSERTAYGKCDRNEPAVKRAIEDIMRDFDMAKITPEYVIASVQDVLLDKTANHSDRLRASELLGKFLAMWKDRQEITHQVVNAVEIDENKAKMLLQDAKTIEYDGKVAVC